MDFANAGSSWALPFRYAMICWGYGESVLKPEKHRLGIFFAVKRRCPFYMPFNTLRRGIKHTYVQSITPRKHQMRSRSDGSLRFSIGRGAEIMLSTIW